ncbi:esterase [Superficieibacter sp.]|uniref:esterase n=1 Tax=Superficieibacter sp. TaxID=2303322 RepID=UPI0028AF00BD|nr:esterase [Superficieibacter sp.]
MIELDVQILANNEIIHAFPAGKGAQPLPCIVFYHGFSSSKLVYSYFAVALAQAGFRVVMPDASEHGARYNGDEQTRMGHFWQILQQNFHEFSALREAIFQQGWVDGQRLAVAGASMGGMTALGLMTRYPDISCVASLMGSGYFTQLSRTLFPAREPQPSLARWDVTQQLATLADRPLMLWHGEEDDVVPAAGTRRLQQALGEAQLDRHLTCHWQAGVRHRITPEALAWTVDFFRQHL